MSRRLALLCTEQSKVGIKQIKPQILLLEEELGIVKGTATVWGARSKWEEEEMRARHKFEARMQVGHVFILSCFRFMFMFMYVHVHCELLTLAPPNTLLVIQYSGWITVQHRTPSREIARESSIKTTFETW